MVQAVNSVKNISFAQQQPVENKRIVNGGCKVVCVPEDYLRKLQNRESKFEKVLGFVGRNFLAGAVISAVFDGMSNAFHHFGKNPQFVMKTSDIAKRAGAWGLCWVAASAALNLIFPSRR